MRDAGEIFSFIAEKGVSAAFRNNVRGFVYHIVAQSPSAEHLVAGNDSFRSGRINEIHQNGSGDIRNAVYLVRRRHAEMGYGYLRINCTGLVGRHFQGIVRGYFLIVTLIVTVTVGFGSFIRRHMPGNADQISRRAHHIIRF